MLNIENISKINNKKKTLKKLDIFLNIAIIINVFIIIIAKFIENTHFFLKINTSPFYDIATIIIIVILPVTIFIKHLINNKIKKLKSNIILLKNK